MYFVFSTFCIFESEVHLRGFVGEPVSDVRPYLAPVDELIEANYKTTEGGREERNTNTNTKIQIWFRWMN